MFRLKPAHSRVELDSTTRPAICAKHFGKTDCHTYRCWGYFRFQKPMLPDKSVFILGAGASRPYLFPTANELRDLILERNESGQVLENMGFRSNAIGEYHAWFEDRMKAHSIDKEDLEQFQTRFRRSQFYSIDAFIAANPKWSHEGSIMIAAILLKCEREATLEGDWYQILFNELVADGRDFPAGWFSIITFNYDRSLETYLLKAFINAYNLSGSEAGAMIERINIVHVYGSLGSLEYGGSGSRVKYGAVGAMQGAAKNIKLVSPRAESEQSAEITLILEKASRLVFLGFGFDPMNLRALGVRRSTIPVFASCYHLPVSTMKHAEATLLNNDYGLAKMFWGDRDHKVADFLSNTPAFAWNI